MRLTHPSAAGVTFLQPFPRERTADGEWRVTLGDLYATSPKSVGLIFHVEELPQLGQTQVAEVHVVSDVVTALGIEHRVITLPVVANLDGTDHVEPTVESSLVRFQAAQARSGDRAGRWRRSRRRSGNAPRSLSRALWLRE